MLYHPGDITIRNFPKTFHFNMSCLIKFLLQMFIACLIYFPGSERPQLKSRCRGPNRLKITQTTIDAAKRSNCWILRAAL